MDEEPLLQARGICKYFGPVVANDTVDFNLNPNEIHALLGENGAGKSTLMNIISGLYRPDAGEIRIRGRPVVIRTPEEAIKNGIGMIHQHFMLIPIFTVAQNIVLGDEITRGIFLDMKQAKRRIRALSETYGLKVDPNALVEDLPLGLQQRVEILKGLYRKAKILILDEPTAVLTPQESEDFFNVMRRLAESGVSIVFITHKLKEVMAVAHRITVMRRGKVMGTVTPVRMDQNRLAEMMVGRKVILKVGKGPPNVGQTVLNVTDLTVKDHQKTKVVRRVSFAVKSGEILGIAGIQGNGQTELALALTGLLPIHSGNVELEGKIFSSPDPKAMIEAGMSHIPEDRLKHGLVLSYSIADNQVLCTYSKPPFAANFLRNQREVVHNSLRLMKQFDIRAPGPSAAAGTLSGGNQQKVIISREFSRQLRLLLANQPTRGLDVGSIEYIHTKLIKMRDNGVAVLLISTELDEIMALSDRIAVMCDGQIPMIYEADKVTRTQLGLIMAGG
jgi:simple sugar transport system ATP-binding protein